MFWNTSTRPTALARDLRHRAKNGEFRLSDVALSMLRRIASSTIDCGTSKGLTIRPVMNGGEVIDPLFDRILGMFGRRHG